MVNPDRRWQRPLPTMYDLPSEDVDESGLLESQNSCLTISPDRRWQHPLPTMYDLPSEDPEESGLPDEFHALQPTLLTLTCQPPATDPPQTCFSAQDLNLYYDVHHPAWYKRPDWFVVMGARAIQAQEDLRLSYVIWQEGISPLLVVELLSPNTEAEDLGRTVPSADKPPTKWQVYEQILRIPFYVIFDRYNRHFRAFRLEGGRYEPLEVRSSGKLWIECLGLGVGVWEGVYQGIEGQWLRFYDSARIWIETPMEQAEREKLRAEAEKERADRAEQAQQEAIPRLAALGLTPAQIAAALDLDLAMIEATLNPP